MRLSNETKYQDALRKASVTIKELLAENKTLKSKEPIAVVGMGCRFPGGVHNPETFWDLVKNEVDAVQEVPVDRWKIDDFYDEDSKQPGSIYTRHGSFLENVFEFDAPFFGITPREAESMDPQQRLLLEVSWEAFEQAGISPEKLRGTRTGVFIGQSNYDYIQAHIHSGDATLITPHAGSGVMFSTNAGRLSYFYDFQGSCMTLDTACSSSLVSVYLAMKSLQSRESDCAIAGGVNLLLSPDSYVALCQVQALSKDGRCRAFDNQAGGYGRGEGCGLLVLKRLSDAQHDGNQILAVLSGGAVNHDGRSNGLTAPNGLSQKRVLQQALEDAGLQPNEIDYIEAHGTGTKLGDPIEFHALQSVFGKDRPDTAKLQTGSVKTNFGHTEASAGVAGLIKAILSIQHKQLPASLHCHHPNEHINWDESSIEVVTALKEWKKQNHARAAGVSSFGLSGTNAHLIVQEIPEELTKHEASVETKMDTDRSIHLLPVSASSDEALVCTAEAYSGAIQKNPHWNAGDIGYSAAKRMGLKKRAVVIGSSPFNFIEGLDAFIQNKKHNHCFCLQPNESAGKKGTVFLYTGQGSQYAGMAKTLYESNPVFADAVKRCDAVLKEINAPSLIHTMYHLPPDDTSIHKTEHAQPALFAMEFALTELWKSWGLQPAAVMGHSIGEYAAAYAAGILPYEEGIRLAYYRGQAMQQLPENGGMAVVFVDEHKIKDLFQNGKYNLSLAAVNSPQCVTVSGDSGEINRLLTELKSLKMAAKRLPVSHAFHSPLMKPVSESFQVHLSQAKYNRATIPFYSTVTGSTVSDTELHKPEYWIRQIMQPVLFYPCLQTMMNDGFDLFLEIGPTNTLTALVQQCALPSTVQSYSSLQKDRDDWEAMLSTAASLFINGTNLDWEALDAPYQRHFISLPSYPFQRKQYKMELSPNRMNAKASHQNPNPELTAKTEVCVEEQCKMNPASIQQNELKLDNKQQVLSGLVDRLAHIGGFAPQDIDTNIRLLEMGLDSLMLFKMGQEVEQSYQVELKVSQFFNEIHSLNDLADYIVKHGVIQQPQTQSDIHMDAAEKISTTGNMESIQNLPQYPVSEMPLGSTVNVSNEYLAFLQQQWNQLQHSVQQGNTMLYQLAQQQLAALGGAQSSPQMNQQHVLRGEVQPSQPALKRKSSSKNFRGVNLSSATILNDEQKIFVQEIVQRQINFAPGSKEKTQNSRPQLADWKHTLSFWGVLKEAKFPIVSSRSKGAYFWDVDGNRYTDLAIGMGVHFFGHNPQFIVDRLKQQIAEGMELGTQCDLTGDVAKLISELTGMERVTFCNTGSEAVMFALRLARAATKRDKIVIFDQSYHGIFDGVLAVEEEGTIKPVGLGTPHGMIEDVYVLEYDSEESLAFIEQHGEELAAVLVEPVQSRNPNLQPQRFLRRLRAITKQSNTTLIFDEMITGFRVHPGGAQAWFDVRADIAAYGKIAGGGMPIGVIAGKADYLDYIDGGTWNYGDHSGPSSEMIYYGGTFGRNPMTMAAAYAVLSNIKENGEIPQTESNRKTTRFCDAVNSWFEQERVPLRIKHFASQWRMVPLGANDMLNPVELELLYLLLMQRGVYTWERRICFFSTEHSEEDVLHVEKSIKESVQEIRNAGFAFESPADYPNDYIPATSVQRRIYALSQQHKGELAYHLPQSFWINGPLDVDRVEDCFAQIIKRHESLRTRFVMCDGELWQKVVAEPRFAVERYEAGEDEIDSIQQLFIRPFDLEQVPLLRVGVVKVSDNCFLLMADAHHIVVDGLSFNSIASEFMALYEQKTLPPVSVTYRDCIRLQEQKHTKEYIEKETGFWKRYLGEDVPVVQLPTDFNRSAIQSFDGEHITSTVEPETVLQLKALARQSGTSLYMILMSVWNTFLYRITGQEDIVVGAPVSGRSQREMMETVGMFVNTIVVKSRVQGNQTFLETVEAVKQSCAQAYDHQDLPFEVLVNSLLTNRDPSRNPLFDVMLSYENADARAFELAGLHFETRDIHLPTSMFDFSLDIVEEQNTLHLNFAYSTCLFRRETIKAWIRSFQKLIQEIIKDPNRPNGRIPLLSEDDQQQLQQWNQTDAEYPSTKTIVELFEEQVAKTPKNMAVRYNGEEWSYEQLNQRANAVARVIQEQLTPSVCKRVAVLLDKSNEAVAIFLGILKAGCAYVPVDPDYPQERIEFMLKDSGCALGITDQKTVKQVKLSHPVTWLYTDQIININKDNLSVSIPPDLAAYCIYTSGSTGVPKGCLVSHRNVVRLLINNKMQFDFDERDVWSAAHSFCFDFSVWEMYGALFYGGCVAIADKETVRDSHQFLDFIRQNKITVLNQTPASFYNLVSAEGEQNAHTLSSHLRYVIFGGDRLEPSKLNAWVKRYPLDQIALINMYGITETTVHVTFHRVTNDDLNSVGRSPVGVPVPSTRVYVCNELMQEQPVGVVGELFVGGLGVCLGYLNRDELTQERFIPSPFLAGERLYKTGDVGRRLPDGSLEYRGRNDRQVQIRGYRVELGEIVACLRKHPNINDAVVLPSGKDDQTELSAYLVTDGSLNTKEITGYISRFLPVYMIPNRYIQLKTIPLTSNGKVDGKALSSMTVAPVESGVEYVAPRNRVEKAMVEVWQQVLKTSRIGIYDNYFASGGDSIKAIFIVNQLQQQKIRVSMSDLFTAQTIAALAQLLHDVTAKPQSVTVGEFPSTPIQSWFFREHQTELHHFNHTVLLRAKTRVNPQALQQTLLALINHHDALRTGLKPGSNSQALQIVPPLAAYVVHEIKRNTSYADSDWQRLIDAEQRNFDLEKPPLFRTALIHLADEDVVLFTAHHLVIDGVSWQILLDDFERAYQAKLQGVPFSLSEKSCSYIDWANAVLDYSTHPQISAQKDYWDEMDAQPVDDFPFDHSVAKNVFGDARTIDAELSEHESRQLLSLKTIGNDLNAQDIFLAAFMRTLYEWKQIKSTRIHLESHGRESISPQLEVTRTVGWFTSLYPVVLENPASHSCIDQLLKVMHIRQQIPQNGIGYGLIRYAGNGPSDGETSVPVIFNYLGEIEHNPNQTFQLETKHCGAHYGENVVRPHALEVEVMMNGGKATIKLMYNRCQWNEETIHGLLNSYIRSLQDILQTCSEEKNLLSLQLLRDMPLCEKDFQHAIKQNGVEKGSIEAVLPLTPLQEGMLFHSLERDDSNAYFSQFTCLFRGKLNHDWFEKSWNLLVQQHSVLRTLFVYDKVDEPFQLVVKNRPVEFSFEDIRTVDKTTNQARLEQYHAHDRERGFDLKRDSLMRVHVFQVSGDEFEMVWSHPHIILDGWSVDIIAEQLLKHYETVEKGMKPEVNPSAQFGDYVRWLKSRNLNASLDYWKSYLHGYDTPAQLPACYPSQNKEYALKECTVMLSTEKSASLNAFAQAQHTTANIVCQTIWGVLLGKLCKRSDVVFGAVVSGRNVPVAGIEHIVGMLLNTVPVRIKFEPHQSISDVIQSVQTKYNEGVIHQSVPLSEIFSLSPLSTQLFQHITVFENYPATDVLHKTQVDSPIHIENLRGHEQLHYPFGIVIQPGKETEFKFTFDQNTYSEERISDWMRMYQLLLDHVVENSAVTIQDMHELLDVEREPSQPLSVLPAWQGDTVIDLFEQQCVLTPDNVALRYGETSLPYQQLNQQADRLAQEMMQAGVEPGNIIGVFMRNGFEHVISMIATMKSGCTLIPLDVDSPVKRFEALLCKTLPTLIITTQEYALPLTGLLEKVFEQTASKILLIDHLKKQSSDISKSWKRPSLHGAAPAYIIFTSGSTGEPKSILCSHESFAHFINWQKSEFQFDESVCAGNLSPLTFDVSLREIFTPLVSGGTVCIPSHDTKMDTVKLIGWLHQNKINVLHIVPGLFRLLLSEIETRANPDVPLQSIQKIFFAGEALLGKDIKRWRGQYHSQAELVNLYGPSETTLAKFFYRIPQDDVDDNSVILLGQPISGTNAFLLKDNREAAAGVIGEICIEPPFDCLGYYGDEQLTAEKFIPNPIHIESARKIYRTGDLGRKKENGLFEFIGRIDRQLKVNGVRVELAEIDRAVLSCKKIDHAVVTPLKKDEGQYALVCYYTEKETVSSNELREELKSYLPASMIPQYFVRLDSFPLNLNGKVNFKALPKPDEFLDDVHNYTPPQNEIEHKLEELWKPLVKLKRVSVTAPFAELGGSSLLAMRLIGRINKAFDSNLTIRDFFECQTIRKIAQRIVEQSHIQNADIPIAPTVDRYPLSSAQRRLWILSQIQPGLPTYNIPYAMRMTGSFHLDIAAKAFETIVQRHEILRTTFGVEQGVPYQVIHNSIDLCAETIDVSQASKPFEDAIERIQKDSQVGFDLTECPLFRLRFYQLKQDDFILYLNIHHIIFDGWSVANLVDEFIHCYDAIAGKHPIPLPPLPIQYKDYAYWEQEQLKSGAMDPLNQYWIKQLNGYPQTLNLPTDYPPPTELAHHGDRVSIQLEPQLVALIDDLCRQKQVTRFMMVTAIVQTLLYRYTAQTDVPVGTPIANRNMECLEPQIGFYVNTLVLRSHIDPFQPFDHLLKQVSQTVSSAFEYQSFPFDRLVDELDVERDPARTPLFEVMIILQNFSHADVYMDGVTVTDISNVFPVSAKFILVFEFVEQTDGSLVLNIEFNTGLFQRHRIERMAGHVQEVLKHVVKDPSQPVKQIPFMAEDEINLILNQFNTLPQILPHDETIISQFEIISQTYSEQLAVVCEDRKFSYKELNTLADSLAAELMQKHSIKPCDFVAVMIERSEWLPVAFLGILKAGAVHVPVDPSYPKERIDYMLHDSNASCVLINQRTGVTCKSIPVIVMESISHPTRNIELPKIQSRDLAYMIYTSGSTGKPKGVLLEHAGGVNLARFHQREFEISSNDRILQFAPSSFDASVWEMLMVFLNGAALVISPPNIIEDLHRFREYIKTKNVTVATLPPSYAAQLKDEDVKSLRILVTAGEKARVQDLLRFSRYTTCFNAYGPTETTICATSHRVNPQNNYESGIPIGKPILNTEIFIMDEHQNMLPTGVPGEICVGGAGLARGYHQQDGLTHNVFVPHPLRKGETIYKTGDIGKWLPNGEIEYIARKDHQVKIRGHRVECGEIEEVLLQHPEIQQTVVSTYAHNGDATDLVAYYVSGTPLNSGTLRAYVENRLPSFMIPNYWMQLERFPLSPSGKIDRKALPSPNGNTASNTYTTPQSEMQTLLASIWSDVLHQKQVGIHDRFFDLGGDSIKAIQMISRIREEGYHCELRELFQHPTIAGIEPYTSPVRSQTALERDLSGSIPLTPIQSWFFDDQESGWHHFNQAVILNVQHTINPDTAKKALSAVVKNHDTFRIRFTINAEVWDQYYAEENAYSFEVLDLSSSSDAEKKQIEHTNHIHCRFDLSQGPLFKAVWYLMPDTQKLLLVSHHAIIDVVSWRIILDDLQTAIQQIQDQNPIQLIQPSATYRQWSNHLQVIAKQDAMQKEISYWKEVVTVTDELLYLDNSKTFLYGDRRSVSFQLPDEFVHSFLYQAHSSYQTEANDLLLTALANALYQWKSKRDMLILLEHHGRERKDNSPVIDRTVGWFTAFYPFRLVLPNHSELGYQIKSVKESLRRVPQKGIGYGLLNSLSSSGKPLISNPPKPFISLNYLGHLQADKKTQLFSIDSDANTGKIVADSIQCLTPIGIEAVIVEDTFHCDIQYDSVLFPKEEVMQFQRLYQQALIQTIEHCKTQNSRDVTPSDVSRVDMKLEEFDALFQD